jgi:hypothetical protein
MLIFGRRSHESDFGDIGYALKVDSRQNYSATFPVTSVVTVIWKLWNNIVYVAHSYISLFSIEV